MPIPLTEMISLLRHFNNTREHDQISGWRDSYEAGMIDHSRVFANRLDEPTQWIITKKSHNLRPVHRYFSAETPIGHRVFVTWCQPDTGGPGYVSGIRASKAKASDETVGDPMNDPDLENLPKWRFMADNQFRAFVRQELGIEALSDASDSDSDFVGMVRTKLMEGRTDVPVDLTSIRDDVYRRALIAVTSIPLGECLTYDNIAQLVKQDNPRSIINDYMVGNALRRNPIPFLIPCHRVVLGPNDPGKWGLRQGAQDQAAQT